MASYTSAYLYPRLSFRSCPDFTRGQRDLASLPPAARTKQQPGLPALQKRLHWRRRRAEWGWGLRRTMRAPRSAVRNSSNPSCWNARPGRLLHSGPNVFVIIPDRSSAPPPPLPPPPLPPASPRREAHDPSALRIPPAACSAQVIRFELCGILGARTPRPRAPLLVPQPPPPRSGLAPDVASSSAVQ